jgi:hypothetical protein
MAALVLAGIVCCAALAAFCAVKLGEALAVRRARARIAALPPRWRRTAGWLALVLALGACVPAQALRLLEVEQAVAAGHAADEGLPTQAREIALDHHDAAAVLLELLDDRPLPADTAARIKARADAAAGAS